jgi:hypothetical protein
LLREKGVAFDEVDLNKGLSVAQLDRLIGSRDYRDFLNSRNELYRERGMKENPPPRAEALKLIEVDYEVLPALMSIEESLAHLLREDQKRWERIRGWRNEAAEAVGLGGMNLNVDLLDWERELRQEENVHEFMFAERRQDNDFELDDDENENEDAEEEEDDFEGDGVDIAQFKPVHAMRAS